jgi:hypothetical protein
MGAAKARPHELAWNIGTTMRMDAAARMSSVSGKATARACRKLERWE